MTFLEETAAPTTPQNRSAPISRARAGLSRRLLIDRAAKGLVFVGGAYVIGCVLAIVLVIVSEVAPLFSPAKLEHLLTKPQTAPGEAQLHVGTDAQEHFAYVVSGDSVVFDLLLNPADQRSKLQQDKLVFPLNSPAGSTVSRFGDGRYAIGTPNGLIIPVIISFSDDYTGGTRRVIPKVEEQHAIKINPEGRPIRRLSYAVGGSGSTFAVQLSERKLRLRNTFIKKALIGGTSEKTTELDLEVPTAGEISALLLNQAGDFLVVGTTHGEIFLAELKSGTVSPFVRFPVSNGAISMLGFLIGNQTLVSGDSLGFVRSWLLNQPDENAGRVLKPHHSYERHPKPVSLFSASGRDKSFITGDLSGNLLLHYSTSGETEATFELKRNLKALALSPKSDGLVTLDSGGGLSVWRLTNPHPEVTFETLFSRVIYEGRITPEYIWQSTASEESEPKFSLIPLIFGTLKGTFYGLFFAVPLAVTAALYTSQFMQPWARAYVKPTVELMAALPSVVIGFIGGLWLAPRIDDCLLGLFIAPFVLVVLVLLSLLIFRALPKPLSAVIAPGTEVFLLMFVVALGLWVSFKGGDYLLSSALNGDMQDYIRNTFGLAYDQRNSIVVAIALGFAVIPLIFTITEDALSSVPKSLVSASLALGATRWQTALRIVLPSASPAIFSAVMIGFGRAVGETMIVLMATGNTPLLDWSPFNGFRALSANIAVEMPEAPVSGTLYRLLFLTALLLFIVTFVVNMLSELVRLRLRRKFQQGHV